MSMFNDHPLRIFNGCIIHIPFYYVHVMPSLSYNIIFATKDEWLNSSTSSFHLWTTSKLYLYGIFLGQEILFLENNDNPEKVCRR